MPFFAWITGDDVPINYFRTYADAAARAADTTIDPANVYKKALQLDDYSEWILLDATPTWQAITSGGGGGSGTVTSVSLSAPGTLFTVSGSPVTTSGTLGLSLATQSANVVFAGPTSGGAATPTFRSLVAADIPTLTLSKISDAGTMAAQNASAVNITGGAIAGITDLAVADGGTGASNAAGARTNLGLVIGTDVQPYDAELAAIAGLVSAADKGIQFTGAGTAATFDLTAAGKALLDDANAAAQRTTLGLGTVATLDSDTDTTLAANSDLKVATQKAVKAYVDAAVTGLLEFKGSTDCSANPNYPAASKGDAYVVSVAGKIGGASGKSVDVSDVYLATADNAGGTEASVGTSWIVLEHNLAGALLAANNLSDVANPATARANLGLAIGTDVQAYDADLAAIAGLTSAANKGIQFTGAGTAATYDLTTAGKALLDDADAAAQRTTLGIPSSVLNGGFTVTFDGGGSTLVVGSKVYVFMPYAGTITKITLIADVSGSVVLDIWKDTYTNYPPTIADTITASAKPTLSSAQKGQDSTLTGWTKTFSAQDTFVINVDSCSTITKLTLIVEATRS